MVIWPTFRMRQYRANEHPYHAPQFIGLFRIEIELGMHFECSKIEHDANYFIFEILIYNPYWQHLSDVLITEFSKFFWILFPYTLGDIPFFEFCFRDLPIEVKSHPLV